MYKDLSSYYGVLEDVDLLCEEDAAILNGFINLLNTVKDSDGLGERPFRPNIGSNLLQYVEDPLDSITAFQIKLALQDIASQFERASLVQEDTIVTPNFETNSFDIYLVLRNAFTKKLITGFFSLNRN